MINRPAIAAPPMSPMRVAEAQALIERIYQPLTAVEDVPVAAARGRVLARKIVALTDLPPFDRAAVDGFAVRHADLSGSTPTMLRLVGRAAAGHPYSGTIGAGEAARILTGAPVVGGADHVVMQEHCIRTDQTVVVPPQQSAKRNIRRRGEDCPAGRVAIDARSRLSPGDIAFAAALGYSTLPVFARLKVALLSTGDELCERGQPGEDGQIADANRPLLASMLQSYGCDVTDCGILPDHGDAIIARLVDAAASHDLIITSGGVSVGDEDHMARVIGRRGCLESWRLRMRPGKPVGIGDIDDCPILALPGNPVAAAAALTLVGRHVVARLSGMLVPWPKPMRVISGFDFQKAADRVECWPCRLWDDEDGPTVAELMPNRGSAMLSSLSGADGFVILDEERDIIRPGDAIDFIPIL